MVQYDRSALALLETVCTASRLRVLKNEEIVIPDLSTQENISIMGIVPEDTQNIFSSSHLGVRYRILLLHTLVWEVGKPTWGEGTTAQDILDKYGEQFDLIVTGDNHESFVVQSENEHTWLVNPGSMMRITADQAEDQPRCFLYYASRNQIVSVDFPIEKDVHNRTHLDAIQERDSRIEAYIEHMKENWDVSVNFEENLRSFFAGNHVPRNLQTLIWKHMEKEMEDE